MALCKFCGKLLPEGVLACPFCNKLVDQPLKGRASFGPPHGPQSGTVECWRCHRFFSEEKQYCPHCGAEPRGLPLFAESELAEDLIIEESETGLPLEEIRTLADLATNTHAVYTSGAGSWAGQAAGAVKSATEEAVRSATKTTKHVAATAKGTAVRETTSKGSSPASDTVSGARQAAGGAGKGAAPATSAATAVSATASQAARAARGAGKGTGPATTTAKQAAGAAGLSKAALGVILAAIVVIGAGAVGAVLIGNSNPAQPAASPSATEQRWDKPSYVVHISESGNLRYNTQTKRDDWDTTNGPPYDKVSKPGTYTDAYNQGYDDMFYVYDQVYGPFYSYKEMCNGVPAAVRAQMGYLSSCSKYT